MSTVDARFRRARLRTPAPLPGHAVLRVRGGRVEQLAAPTFARPGDRVAQVDLRTRLLTLAPQAIAVREGVDVHVTAAVRLRVADAVRLVTTASAAEEEVYLAVQIALREVVAGTELEELLRREVDLAPVLAAARTAGEAVGLQVLDVLLKDVSAPRSLADAREQALVTELEVAKDLERARGEVKATRARLAAAQMLEKSPVLARLRLLESLPYGTTLKVDGSLGIGPAADASSAPAGASGADEISAEDR
ncbi:SPFH domain-containing protein [Brachybacterium sp. Marseille-Q7125]|uniref:SPFH domain-containing protein n=1 Tax=Brachybacterium sp. Marseille-Q7125 TaxID=2932815 RepID=UPI001FF2DFFA|nr:SPFH domain-containing protein [Brachybacterium sp. Marseille-Q7125]